MIETNWSYFQFLPQTPTPEQEGPSSSSLAFLEAVGSKELAFFISQYDYEIFNAVNVVSIQNLGVEE